MVVLVVSGFILGSHENKYNSEDVSAPGNVRDTWEYTDKMHARCSTGESQKKKSNQGRRSLVVYFVVEKKNGQQNSKLVVMMDHKAAYTRNSSRRRGWKKGKK